MKNYSLAETMSFNPSKILNLEPTTFKTGNSADFFILDMNGETIIRRENKEYRWCKPSVQRKQVCRKSLYDICKWKKSHSRTNY